MNDESLTPATELASAALDGELTPVERARVDESPVLTDELAFYADLRDRIADVEVPPAARDAALLAALSAFDDLGSTDRTTLDGDGDGDGEDGDGDTDASSVEDPWTDASSAGPVTGAVRTTGATVVSLHERRRKQYRWLGGAAAAAFVAIVGVGVIANNNSSNDDSSSGVLSSGAADSALKQVEVPSAAGGAAESAETTAAATATGEADNSSSDETSAADTDAQTGPAPMFAGDPWADAPAFDSTDAVRVFVMSPDFGMRTMAGTETTAENTADTTAASTAETTAASTGGATVDTAAPPDSPTQADTAQQCLSGTSGPSAAVLYLGQQVFVVRDDFTNTVSIIDPIDCGIIDSFRL